MDLSALAKSWLRNGFTSWVLCFPHVQLTFGGSVLGCVVQRVSSELYRRIHIVFWSHCSTSQMDLQEGPPTAKCFDCSCSGSTKQEQIAGASATLQCFRRLQARRVSSHPKKHHSGIEGVHVRNPCYSVQVQWCSQNCENLPPPRCPSFAW